MSKIHKSPYVGSQLELAAVIPAAGEPNSTWTGLHTSRCNAMFPIAGKPAIYWTLQDICDFGINRVSIVVRERNNELERFVVAFFASKLELHFVQPDRSLGVGYSVFVGARVFPEKMPLLVVLGDTISQFVASRAVFDENTVYVAEVKDYERWCLATIENGHVLALHDKPNAAVGTNWALTGIYFFKNGWHSFAEKLHTVPEIQGRLEMANILEALVENKSLVAHHDTQWLDVGNPEHVYEAQSRLIQSRSFNKLQVDQIRGTITKRSSYQSKFYDEINYYKLLPEKLQVYFPRVVSSNTQAGGLELTLEYYAYPSLADLFLFSNLSPYLWDRIFLQLRSICRAFTSTDYGSASGICGEIYLKKNRDRLEAFLREPPAMALPFIRAANPTVNGRAVPSLSHVYNKSESALSRLAGNAKLSPVHGDLCFSNILCEPARGLIKFIDPRGCFGRQGVLGDFRYDFAKLTHSVCGLYDWIVNDLGDCIVHESGDMELSLPTTDNQRRIQEGFREIFSTEYDHEEVELITAWLFLSMLPLHAESPKRQVAMMARGLQLLANLKL